MIKYFINIMKNYCLFYKIRIYARGCKLQKKKKKITFYASYNGFKRVGHRLTNDLLFQFFFFLVRLLIVRALITKIIYILK